MGAMTAIWKSIQSLGGKKAPEGNVWDHTFVVLDTETTGFDTFRDRILSIGALTLARNTIQVNQTLELYLRQEHYNSESTEVHCLLKKELREYHEEKEAVEILAEFVGNKVIIAHHSSFDLAMINSALRRHGLTALNNPYVDTATLFRKTLIKSPLLAKKETYSLDELADKLDISKKDRHTALGDAYITAIAFLKIVQELRKKYGQVPLKHVLARH